ncbi:hypothetical protein L6R49_08000 [Myxococcota bacterium]|nr:hypothetical protein [Myxococcota bacterium]
MRFKVHAPATTGDDRALRKLNEILSRVEDGVHTLVFEAPDQLNTSRWFQHLYPLEQELVGQLILAETYPSTPTTTCTIKDPEDVHAARDLAYTPLTILVENEFSDGALIRAAVEAYASPEVKDTWERGQNVQPRGWAFIGTSGSGQLPKKIDDLCRGQPNRRVLPVRDSDEDLPLRMRPPATKPKSAAVEEAARRNGIPCFVLPLRTIENYLPDKFWEEWLNEDPFRTKYKPTIAALKQLSPDQRDHVDMAEDKRLKPGATLGPLFDGSDQPNNPKPSDEARAALTSQGKHGLKQRSDKKADEARPANILRLPEYVKAGKVTAADLDQRDRPRSLRALVNLLSELL